MEAIAESTRRHCFFSGRVQGVGFRYTARNIAIGYDVTGFVRNLPDGRVELVVEGPGSQVECFIDDICDRMRSYIHEKALNEEPVSGQFGQFTIAR